MNKASETITDFTAHHHQEQASNMANIPEQQYWQLIDALPFGVLFQQQGKILYANAVLIRMLGLQNSLQLAGSSFYDLLHQDYRAAFIESLQQLTRQGQVIEIDEKLVTADNRIIDVEISAAIVNINQQDLVQLTFKNISKRKHIERALKQSVEEFRQLAESMPQFVWTARPDGWIDYMNSRWHEYTGQTIEETQGWGWESVMHPNDLAPCIERWTEALKTGDKYEMEYRYRRAKDGTYRWHLGRASSIKDEQGNVIKWIGTSTDIHDQKMAEEEARRLNQELELRVKERTAQLELANQELESFSYSVSHDLRAPLRHIVSFVGLLAKHLQPLLDEKAQHYINVISESAHNLQLLVDNLLEFSRMGRIDLRKQVVDLNELVKNITSEMAYEVNDRSIAWHIGPLPAVYADPIMLKQVFVNLLNNAVKFTRNRALAEISIGTLQQNETTLIYIKDNGVGFDMKYVDKLFGVFQRLHSKKEFEGTGIGLANVHRIIQRHGGQIWVESKPDEGTTFYFTLLIAKRDAE